MTYANIANMAESPSLIRRLIACAAEQKKGDPYNEWVYSHVWDIAASPGWSEKWASALAADIPDPGADEGVITDADILAVIQPME